ncbi:phage head closure protein [Nitrosomonas marina]|uniref:Phage head-tail adaptor, putative, SPP1 family n=1 Tax=Nitrosomonas marina TaxID=917 RepID=A0A1H8GJN0_9PROT|nr:phage head closure protein [Nitrosomonas marina]SEN43518.1 phage head-tail adaptor, putative, SPP1 family [Nitrosomonas marina]
MSEPTIGELNRKITIERVTQIKDSEGGLTDDPSVFVSDVWASVDNYSGNEPSITKHGGQPGVSRVLFKMRYVSGVDSTMRVVYDGKYYAIKHVSNYKEKNRWLYLDCETGKNSGH